MGLQVTSRGQQDFPVESGHLTQCTLNGERGNPDRFLETGSEVAIPNDGLSEWEARRSEGHTVMVWIRI